MKQNDLNRAIARVTGETVATVKRLGFLLAEPGDVPFHPDDEALGPHVLDWDEPEPDEPDYDSLPEPCDAVA